MPMAERKTASRPKKVESCATNRWLVIGAAHLLVERSDVE